MRLEPLSAALGATVLDVDLTQPLTPALVAGLREALARHGVLFFRDQPIEPAHHRALAEAFGPTQPHPAYPCIPGYPELSILEVNADAPPKIDAWHADMTFMAAPPLGSILHGVHIPPAGGDTLFSSLARAYDALSTPFKRLLAELQAVHDFSYGFRHSLAEPGGRERLAQAVRDNPPVTHPVVCTHPDTGVKLLYVNPLFTTHIVGLSDGESRAILDYLYTHMITPEFTCRFRWQPDSIAFWDNRATLHRPINDYWPGHRRMQRITIAGTRPS